MSPPVNTQQMNYIKQLNAFYDLVTLNPLSTGQIALWNALMHINNRCSWIEWFAAPSQVLEVHTGLSRSAILKARNELKQRGFIDFKTHGTKATSYKMRMLYSVQESTQAMDTIANSAQDSTQIGVQDGTQVSVQNSTPLIKHKQKPKLKQNNISPLPPYDDFGFSSEMRERLDEWIAYKKEMGKSYKQLGLNNLLKTVQQEIGRLGENTVLNRITYAMASGWQGMNLDKLEPNCQGKKEPSGRGEAGGKPVIQGNYAPGDLDIARF